MLLSQQLASANARLRQCYKHTHPLHQRLVPGLLPPKEHVCKARQPRDQPISLTQVSPCAACSSHPFDTKHCLFYSSDSCTMIRARSAERCNIPIDETRMPFLVAVRSSGLSQQVQVSPAAVSQPTIGPVNAPVSMSLRTATGFPNTTPERILENIRRIVRGVASCTETGVIVSLILINGWWIQFYGYPHY